MIAKKQTESYERDSWEYTGEDAEGMLELILELDSFVCKLIELLGSAIEINPNEYQPPHFYIGSGEDMVFVAPVASWYEYKLLCDECYVRALEDLS